MVRSYLSLPTSSKDFIGSVYTDPWDHRKDGTLSWHYNCV